MATPGVRGLFAVRARLLAEVAKWAYQQDDRPHLACVLFDGLHMVATNGHRVIVAPCPTELPPFVLPRVEAAALVAAQREITKQRGAELLFTSVGSGRANVELEHGGCTVVVRALDAKSFPPWEQPCLSG